MSSGSTFRYPLEDVWLNINFYIGIISILNVGLHTWTSSLPWHLQSSVVTPWGCLLIWSWRMEETEPGKWASLCTHPYSLNGHSWKQRKIPRQQRLTTFMALSLPDPESNPTFRHEASVAVNLLIVWKDNMTWDYNELHLTPYFVSVLQTLPVTRVWVICL